MPRFTIERNWIECIGHLWMPNAQAAKRIELRDYDISNIQDIARECFDSETITREAVDHWLALNEGDFQGVEDFAAFITDAPEMPWSDPDNEFIYTDCMFPSED